MGKKKSKIIEFENDPVSNQINKKSGAIVEAGSQVLATLENFNTIGVSPALDIALGGGLREGSCVVMTGDPKTGKTTTALYFAAKAQKAGKNVFYFNTEGRLTKENFKGIKDLDIDKIKIVQATDKEPMVSAEKYLNTLETYIKNTPDLVAIVDSTSSMVPQDELDGEIRTGVRNALPRLLSMFFKRISGDVARMKAICIFITHNIANTGGSRYSPNKMADCGNMLQYQAGTNMVITHRGKWEVPKDSGNHVGQVANWVIKTSAAGGTPNSTAEGWIRYGIGIDECQEVAQIASEFAMINRSGAWYTISCAVENKDDPVIKNWLIENEIDHENDEAISKAFKFQGMEKVNTFLEENTEITQFIYQQIREVFL
jgi:recombination protein RecA